MASSIAVMVSGGTLVLLYVCAYHGTILSATSSLNRMIITIVYNVKGVYGKRMKVVMSKLRG